MDNIKTHRYLFTLCASFALFLSAFLPAFAQQEVVTHTVASGETLYGISRDYNVSVDQLYQLNPDVKEGIKAGQLIKIPIHKASSQEPQKPQYHKVERGETLYSIARMYGVSPTDLQNANSVLTDPDKLSVGMIIQIPTTKEDTTILRTKGSTPKSDAPMVGVTGLRMYKVPQGATIYSLLRVTGWTEEQLFHYNPQIKKGLKADDTILIPDASLPNNKAVGQRPAFPVVGGYTVVLALPFSNDNGNRFSRYYEGFLMALLEAKKTGKSVHLFAIDSNSSQLSESISSLQQLPKVDLILGGVSEGSIEALATLAQKKHAIYVVPFTSKDYTKLARKGANIYQVNTPHEALYREVARKFVKEYRNDYVQFVQFPSDESSKPDFTAVLKEECRRAGISYGEVVRDSFSAPSDVVALSSRHTTSVVVPEASSLTAANNILRPIQTATDSLGVSNVTVFGYPEWQTYDKSIGDDLRAVEGAFYTTFLADSSDNRYKSLENEYKDWYGHGLGNTYPRYSILGYDTGRFFLNLLGNESAGSRSWNGVQSKFEFEENPVAKSLKSNLGVFFVQYKRSGEKKRL